MLIKCVLRKLSTRLWLFVTSLWFQPVSIPALFAWEEPSEAVSKESEEGGKEKSLQLTAEPFEEKSPHRNKTKK